MALGTLIGLNSSKSQLNRIIRQGRTASIYNQNVFPHDNLWHCHLMATTLFDCSLIAERLLLIRNAALFEAFLSFDLLFVSV